MSELATQHCVPCEGGVKPFSLEKSQEYLKKLEGWELLDGGKAIERRLTFKGFHQTMAFVNALAWVANQELHHPDLKIGYNYCHILYTTHAIDGLSENDFICAAKIDKLLKK